jgi:Cu(I)/Ag(I) efflux system membrane protein CusA/SilA
VRYARELRDDPARFSQVLVATPVGPQVPLTQLAEVSFSAGAPVIKSENGQLVGMVFIDVRDRDVGSYVAEARRLVDDQIVLPAGYRLEWSGQYEALERVKARLMIMVPVTLGIIALLLYFNFLNIAEVAIVMFSLPFALVGGVWLMWLLDYDFSVAVAVGFIALGGLAAQTGVVMLLYLDQAWNRATASGPLDIDDLMAVIEEGAVGRVRPKLMTVVAIVAGLLPLMWAHGAGASVIQRIAAPMIGGMITSTVLTLVVIPVLYYLWRRREVKAGAVVASVGAQRIPESE